MSDVIWTVFGMMAMWIIGAATGVAVSYYYRYYAARDAANGGKE